MTLTYQSLIFLARRVLKISLELRLAPAFEEAAYRPSDASTSLLRCSCGYEPCPLAHPEVVDLSLLLPQLGCLRPALASLAA